MGEGIPVMYRMLVYDLVYLYTWCKCYCMSIWLAWLFLAWCSHDYCDIMDLVIVIYLWLTCTQLLYLVLWWTQRVPGIISYFECFCSCAIELFEL